MAERESDARPIRVLRDLEYAGYEYKGTGHGLHLDLFLPTELEEPAPLLVFLHGGGWVEGSRDSCPGTTFARLGFAMACVDYRLSRPGEGCPEVLAFPAAVHDAKTAVRWLRGRAAEYDLDPDRIAVIGDSAGGHLASLLGVSAGAPHLAGEQSRGVSDEVQAVVDWYGPVDFTQGPPIVFEDDPCTTEFGALVEKYGGEATQYFYWTFVWGSFLGGSLADPMVIDRGIHASPLMYIGPEDPPFLVVHGEADDMVPIGQSALLVTALQEAGVSVTFIRVPEMGHFFGGPPGSDLEVNPTFLEPTMAFLNENLRAR
jgi:acetyl esterase/lipase